MGSPTNSIASMGNLRQMNVSSGSFNSQSDQQKMNLYKNMKMKFYLHKSFDVQSDMEFLPALPNETARRTSPSNSPRFQYRGTDYYGNNQFQMNGMPYDNNTPRSRMTYSPRRNQTNMNMRGRRVASAGNAPTNNSYTPSYSPMLANSNTEHYDQNHLMQNRVTQFVNRNW